MIPQLQRETPVSAPEQTATWSLATRIGFRFVFSYAILYFYPIALGSRGGAPGDAYQNPVRSMWAHVVPWVGANVLHLSGPLTESFNGSGDQQYDYVLWFCITVFAVVAAAVWSLLDRKRTNYEVLYQWLRIFVRLSLAITMLSYGWNKLYRMQFPEIKLAKLLDTYGQSSPEGLLWAFMDFSRAYSFFGGVGETLGGMLLVIPGLTTLGALITAGVMSNVLVMNFCYDVSRKIFSIHIMLMCIFLLLPDMRRLLEFFVLRRQVQLAAPRPLFRKKSYNTGLLVIQIGIGIYISIVCASQGHRTAIKYATHLQAPLRGIWAVDEFIIDAAPRPPLITDTQRWQRVIFDNPDELTIQPMDGTLQQYAMKLDTVSKSASLLGIDKPGSKGTLTINISQPDRLTLQGEMDGHQVSAVLSRVNLDDSTKFVLTNRGFHWVTPFVFSR